jgi:Cell wall hydrolyses involved in spore germination
MFSEKEVCLLMKIAMAEAEDEDTEGKALVMRVVLNRVRSRKFPDSIREVIYQDIQFSPVANGRFDRVEPDRDCRRALEMIQKDGWDGSKGALYFESKSKSTWHEDNLRYLFRHGGHYFYTDREAEE